MRRRGRGQRIALFAVAGSLLAAAASAQPPVRIGVVVDGPWDQNQAIQALTVREVTALTEGEFDVSFPEEAYLVGDWRILSNNVDGTPILVGRSYTNFGDVDTEGIDLGLNYYVDENWTVMLSLSTFDFTLNNSQPGFDDILQPNTPESKGSFGINYVSPKWDFGFSARWVDSFRWVVGPFIGTVESYTTADVTTNFVVNDNVKLGLNIANAFDEKHWESFGGDILERRALGSVTFNW